MKLTIPIIILLLIFSCNKNSKSFNENIIKNHVWYPFKIHQQDYNDSTNLLLKDTSYIFVNCTQQSVYQFFNDSIVKRSLICVGLPVTQGKWYLTSEGNFSANIPVRQSYGAGFIISNAGINLSKLLEIDDAHFTLSEIQYRYDISYNTFLKRRIELTTTYKSQ